MTGSPACATAIEAGMAQARTLPASLIAVLAIGGIEVSLAISWRISRPVRATVPALGQKDELGVTELGIHLGLIDPERRAASADAAVEAARAQDASDIEKCRQAAVRIADAFEPEIARGRADETALFVTRYAKHPIPNRASTSPAPRRSPTNCCRG